MAKRVGTCAECKHYQATDEMCMYPRILHTFPTGIAIKDARGVGRYCGPNGQVFKSRIPND